MNKHFDVAVIGGGAAGLFFTAIATDTRKNCYPPLTADATLQICTQVNRIITEALSLS